MKKMIIVWVLMCFSIGANAQQCDNILKYIYDFRSQTIDDSQKSSFVNWIKSLDYEEKAQRQSKNATLDAIFSSLFLSFNYNDSRESFEKIKRQLSTFQSASSEVKTKITTTLQTVNPKVVDAWDKCNQQCGAHIWSEQLSNPKQFRIVIFYKQCVDEIPPTITNFTFFPTQNVTYQDGPFFTRQGGLKKNAIPKGTPVSQVFERVNNESISIDISTTFPQQTGSFRDNLPTISNSTAPSQQKRKVLYQLEVEEVDSQIFFSLSHGKGDQAKLIDKWETPLVDDGVNGVDNPKYKRILRFKDFPEVNNLDVYGFNRTGKFVYFYSVKKYYKNSEGKLISIVTRYNKRIQGSSIGKDLRLVDEKDIPFFCEENETVVYDFDDL